MATKLPNAPSLNIYCLYGVGIETERSYYYKVSCDRIGNASWVDRGQACPPEDEEKTQQCGNEPNPNDDEPPESPFFIDTAAKDDSRNVHSGVRFSDGDATVPLLSLYVLMLLFRTAYLRPIDLLNPLFSTHNAG
jgi:phospholipid:diacylglycerol acyltransferase